MPCAWCRSSVQIMSIEKAFDVPFRFLYVLQFYIANGFYVVLDYHAGSGHIETDRQVVANCPILQRNWLALLVAIQSLEVYAAHIKGESYQPRIATVMQGHSCLQLQFPLCPAEQACCTRVSELAVSMPAGRLFFDLVNEPDAFNFLWNQFAGNPRGDHANSTNVEPWSTLYQRTVHLLLKQESALLFFLQGTSQLYQPGSAHGKFSNGLYYIC